MEEKILSGKSDAEKSAYLSAIASLATADSQASPQELEYLKALCEAADLPADHQELVLRSASEIHSGGMSQNLDVLKNSDLKYSLLTDLLAFAKSDGDYSSQEQQNIQQMANYLGIDQKQFEAIDELANHAASPDVTPEQLSQPSFLSSTGIGDKLQQSGINVGGLLKGLMAVAAPIIISKMMNRNNAGQSGVTANPGGGMLGGLLGGDQGSGGGLLGGLLGGATQGSGGGGLGSLIGMLSGGRGIGGAGGLLGGLFGK